MTTSLDFYFDVGSPSAYLAFTQLPALIRNTGATVNYRPVLLGAVFAASGNASPMTIPAKGRYLVADLARYARHLQVPLAINPHFPFVTLPLMRMAVGLQDDQPQQFAAFVDAVFRAVWVDGRNLGDMAEIAAVLSSAGLDADAILAMTKDPDIKDKLKQRTEQAVARGLFGVPTFFVGDEMFWGQDRLAFVEDALRGDAGA